MNSSYVSSISSYNTHGKTIIVIINKYCAAACGNVSGKWSYIKLCTEPVVKYEMILTTGGGQM